MKQQHTIRDHVTFRSVLRGMSRPGTVQRLPESGGADYLITLLSSLIDNEVTVAAIGVDWDELLKTVVRATGCRLASVGEADFVLVLGGDSGGQLSKLRRGASEYPETGATVLYLLEEVAEEGGDVSLSGPGIKNAVRPSLRWLADTELKLLGEVNRNFPLGLDAIFLDLEGRFTCIPRSVQIGVK